MQLAMFKKGLCLVQKHLQVRQKINFLCTVCFISLMEKITNRTTLTGNHNDRICANTSSLQQNNMAVIGDLHVFRA